MGVINGLKDSIGGAHVARNPEVFPPPRFDVETAAIGVGDRVRVKLTGDEATVRKLEQGYMLEMEGSSWWYGPYRRHEIEPIDAPPAPVAAVVVRGLGCGETARVVLCRTEEEAAREQQRNGGVVVAAGQINWA